MRSRIIARNSLLTTVDVVFSTLGSFVTVVLVARAMGPEKLGYYTYVLWLVHVANIVGLFGVPSATRKYVAEFLGKGDVATAKAVTRATFRLQFVTSFVLTGAGSAIAIAILPVEHRGYTVLALLSLIPSMLMAIPSGVHLAIEDFASNVYPSMIGMLVNVVGVLIVLEWRLDLVGLSAALLLARTANCGARYYLYSRRFPEYLAARFTEVPPPAAAIPAELRKRMVRFCWQATGLLILNMVVWNRSEVFFLRYFSDIREVAFYSMSFGLMRALAELPQAFSAATGANLMTQHGLDPKPVPQLVATTLRYQSLLILPMALGMAALSSPFVRLFYGERYEPAIPVLAIVALFCIPAALMGGVRQLLIAAEHQGFLLKWGIITATINIVLDLWWIPRGGAIGAAMGNGVSQTVAVLGIWVFVVREFRVPLPWRWLLKVASSAVAMAAVVKGVCYLFAPAPAVILGVFIGVVSFLLLLRWTRSLEPADRGRLISFQQSLPPRFRNWYVVGVQMVAP